MLKEIIFRWNFYSACAMLFTLWITAALIYVISRTKNCSKNVNRVVVSALIASMLFIFCSMFGMRDASIALDPIMEENSKRTVNILNSDGKVVRTYTEFISIETDENSCTIVDRDGKEYVYYNCYVETIPMEED